MSDAARALAEAARETVQSHKRAANAHRRQARRLMAALRAFCAEHGIPFDDDGEATQEAGPHERSNP